jgi:sulfide:quinone oxidoreductase
MAARTQHHRVVIVGGGSAGISVAARLRRSGESDVAVVEPAEVHYYQPLWTLVGGGRAPLGKSARPQASVMPSGVTWIKEAATDIDAEGQRVELASGSTVSYDYLVACPGIALDWDRLPGSTETLGRDGVSSNYQVELAPKTWEYIKKMRSGTAIFSMPSGPIKCAGAPQKIAYLAADHWRREGVLKDIHIVLVLPTPKMFGVPEFSAVLDGVAKRYGIDVRLSHEVVEVDPDGKQVLIANRQEGSDEKFHLPYDMAHLVPPQSAPAWVRSSPLADPDNPGGYIQIDKETMRHVRYPNVFGLGDAGSSPNSKTGAAIRKQAPVVVENLKAVMAGREPSARYDGYASCPLTTARNRMLLAEFDYTMKPHPTFPLINTQKERYDMWLVKRYGLPALYWNLMLKGLA